MCALRKTNVFFEFFEVHKEKNAKQILQRLQRFAGRRADLQRLRHKIFGIFRMEGLSGEKT